MPWGPSLTAFLEAFSRAETAPLPTLPAMNLSYSETLEWFTKTACSTTDAAPAQVSDVAGLGWSLEAPR